MKGSVILKERSRWHNVTFPFFFFCRFGKVSFNFGTKFHWWNGNNCVVRYWPMFGQYGWILAKFFLRNYERR